MRPRGDFEYASHPQPAAKPSTRPGVSGAQYAGVTP